MDDAARRLAREMTEAIAKAVEADGRVRAIRRRARESGLEMRVTLDATIRFADVDADGHPDRPLHVSASAPGAGAADLSESDRQFLRSLRIAAPGPIRVD